MARQTGFVFRIWGGARKGAGRKPAGIKAGALHTRRPKVDDRVPLHLTMRVAGVPSLRSQQCIKVMRAAFRGGKERFGFRLVHYAVQPNHLHLIVEAKNRRALSSGARGLAIRIAMRLNHLLGRTGRVFTERYHAVPLGSPRQVRRALAYVLLQERRHAAGRRRALTTSLDRCSSAPGFDGFKNVAPRAGSWSETVVEAGTWLLTTGWRRHGTIDPREVPGSRCRELRARPK
jgi:REP element-mobilizing transposase RayT